MDKKFDIIKIVGHSSVGLHSWGSLFDNYDLSRLGVGGIIEI